MGQSPHVRRDSQASTHGEGVGHGGPAHGRGGYQGQGRGRGGFNQQYNNATMGYPPNRNFSGPNAGRGGMPPYHQGRGGMQQFPNSPQPHRASPATTPAMPHVTPTMQPAALAAGGAQPYYHHAMNPAIPPYPHQVKSLPINNDFPTFKSQKKNKAARRDSEKGHHLRGPSAGHKQTGMELVVHKSSRHPSKRWDSAAAEGHQNVNGAAPSPEYSDVPPPHYHFQPGRPVPMFAPQFMGPIDLSPESGTFEKLLTANKLQMGAPYSMPPPLDGYGRMNYQYPPQPMNHYMPQPTQFPPQHQGFVPTYAPGQPGAQPMSRNASQVSDRPASSTGQNQAPAIAQGTPQQRPAQVAPAIVSSPAFTRPPKKSAAIVIKNSDGQVVDLSAAMKAPASPVPSIQQSKTPPAIVSTPTPPPKPTTPSHGRTDSTSTGKTAEQVRNEFMNLVRKQADAPSESKAKEEEEAAAKAAEEKAAAEKAAADKAAEEQAAAEKAAAEKAAAEQAAAEKAASEKAAADKAAADKAAAEKAAAEEKAKEEARLEAEKKAAEETKAKEQAEAEAKAKAEAEAAAAAKQQPKEEKKSADEMSDEDMERMIREMEEEDARREKEQEEISAKKKAQREEEKKRAEASKLSSADNDKKLKEQEAEMERIEEERERRRAENEAKGQSESLADLLAKDKKELAEKPSAAADASTTAKAGAADKAKSKPAALNLAPLKTTPVEAPQPSAALQSLRSARFLPGVEFNIYPAGIASPNPALNAAVHKKGKIFKYDAQFLLQFQQVFTEQPSLEFHQQVKSLIGDSDGSRSASARTPGAGGSSRQASRAGGSSSAFPPGGAFGQFGSKPLPPGTTSEQRFAMSQGSGPSRPGMGAPGPFNRTGVFPGQMSRTPSSGPGGLPSPRTGSRRGGGSRKDFGNAKAEAQAAKTMPLTQGMELKPIAVTATGWKPSSVGSKAGPAPTGGAAQGAHLEPEIVQRKVKAALNKMTPENFDKISEQILVIAGQSKNEQDGRTLRQVIQLTFEKATDEAHWASMYAKFAKRMLETMSPEIRDENIIDKAGNVVSGGALFRKYLLNRCQEEFERGWKVDLPQPKEGEDKKATEAALLSDEYYIAAAAKRRGLGLVQFIGELYKLNMLTERIMHECVRKLLEFTGIPDEAEIESLTKLLKTIGGNLESTEKGRAFMEAYFQRIDTIIHLDGLPSRLMFMLMDIIDLRKSGWVSKEANKGPKTLEEVRAEVCLTHTRFTPLSQSLLILTRHEPGRGSCRTEGARERSQQPARSPRWPSHGRSGRVEKLLVQQPAFQPGRHGRP